jgi:hypothetical protein
MGGLDAGPIDQGEHAHAPWEKKVDALLRLLTARKVMTLDELRRGIEEIGPGAYDQLAYFERWITSISNVMIEKGLIEVGELARRMEQVRSEAAAAGRPT